MKIAYLIPEFPGQTHSFFWRERIALKEIGVATQLVSTRHPPRAIISHDWAEQAQSETFYLSETHPTDFLHTIIQLIGFGPTAWFRSIKAAADGCPLRKWVTLSAKGTPPGLVSQERRPLLYRPILWQGGRR